VRLASVLGGLPELWLSFARSASSAATRAASGATSRAISASTASGPSVIAATTASRVTPGTAGAPDSAIPARTGKLTPAARGYPRVRGAEQLPLILLVSAALIRPTLFESISPEDTSANVNRNCGFACYASRRCLYRLSLS